jgi:hypothetical protein
MSPVLCVTAKIGSPWHTKVFGTETSFNIAKGKMLTKGIGEDLVMRVLADELSPNLGDGRGQAAAA